MKTKTKNYILNLSPTQYDLNQIEKWLIQEYEISREGFYCNWNIIEKAFHNKSLITLIENDFPIGFLVWQKVEIYAELDIMVIKPDYRNREIGKYFLNQIAEYFKKNGFLAVKCFCSSKESERFIKKMEFIEFPFIGYYQSEMTYYKPLIDIQQATENNPNNKIELWCFDPYEIRRKNHQPKWRWEINANLDKLSLPILQPCHPDWNLRWTKNGKIIKEDKVKYFSDNNIIYYSTFLYISTKFQVSV